MKEKDSIEWSKVFRVLALLEHLGGNKEATARELQMSKNTVYRYYNRYWDKYLEHKKRETSVTTEVVIPSSPREIDKIPSDVASMYGSAVDLVAKRIAGDDDKSQVTNSQLVNLVSNLTPYFMAKKEPVPETPDKVPSGQRTGNTFIQNFIDTVNNYKPVVKDDNDN